MSPLISIVTITYNDLNGFKRTAKSILPQLIPSVEWIIKDGGSRPEVLQEMKKFISHTSCNFLSSHDTGVYNAMNQALPFINGSWLIFMNGGDEFASLNTLSEIQGLIYPLSLNPSDNILLAGGTQIVSKNGHSTYKKPRSMAQCSGINCYRMAAYHQSQIYSKSIFTKQHFRETLRISADHAFFWDAINRGARVLQLDLPISRFYPGGLSSQKWLRSCLDVGYSIFVIQDQKNFIGVLAFLKRLLASFIRFF